MDIQFTPQPWEDYLYWQPTDKQTLTGKEKPESLRYKLQGCWSRCINQEHRLVYQVERKILQVTSVRFHY